jgi:hypothetical protein
MVPVTVEKLVPVTTCRMVQETCVKQVPTKVCTMVQEVVCKKVPVCVNKMVPYTAKVKVPYTVTECVPTTVCNKVAVCKEYEVKVKKPRIVCETKPVKPCVGDKCGPVCGSCKPGLLQILLNKCRKQPAESISAPVVTESFEPLHPPAPVTKEGAKAMPNAKEAPKTK